MSASIWSPGSTITIDSASLLALFQIRGGWCGTAGGTADAIVLTPTSVLAAYAAGQQFSWIASGPNTGPVTVAISGLAPISLVKEDNVALAAEDIPGVSVITATYDGTRLILMEVASVNKSLFTAAGDEIVSSAAGVPARMPATANVAAHATTCNPWVARNIILTGAVVTFTALANAPYIGAVSWIKANDAHVFTNGATFRMPGLANYTCADGDWLRIEAVTLSTFSVAIFKADGTPVVQQTIATTPTVRQTVRLAAVDSSGYTSFISAGVALNYNISATTTPAVLDFAAGNTDYTATISANASNQGTLVADNTNHLYATYASSITVTWGNCLIPPQYGYAFERSAQSLLNFEGADGSTSMIDDFGNTWTAAGNAQIDTAQFKFGTSSLLLDGTGDYIESTNFTSLGDGSWEISMWVRFAVLPTAGNRMSMIHLYNAGAYGALLYLYNNAGTTRTEIYLSSTGTSNDISTGGIGTNTVWAINTWYKFRVVFDALAGTYRIYLSIDGAAETQDLTLSNTARICGFTTARIGRTSGGIADLNGHIDAFRFIRAATVTATETPASSAFSVTSQPVHYFSIPEMKMYEVTAASVAAGNNPTLTAVNRLFVGEADTGAATVSAVRNYAIRGEYQSADTAMPGVNVKTSFSHLIGVPCDRIEFYGVMKNYTADFGFTPGEVVDLSAATDVNAMALVPYSGKNRNTMDINSGSVNTGWGVINKNTGARSSVTVAYWRMIAKAKRDF